MEETVNTHCERKAHLLNARSESHPPPSGAGFFQKVVPVFLFLLLSTACATSPDRPDRMEPSDLPKEAVMFQFGYLAAFERMVNALEAEGYNVVIADQRAGFIQTELKEISVASDSVGSEAANGEAKLKYRGFYRIRLEGGRDRSWALIQFLVVPELPGEQKKLIRRIQGEAASSP